MPMTSTSDTGIFRLNPWNRSIRRRFSETTLRNRLSSVVRRPSGILSVLRRYMYNILRFWCQHFRLCSSLSFLRQSAASMCRQAERVSMGQYRLLEMVVYESVSSFGPYAFPGYLLVPFMSCPRSMPYLLLHLKYIPCSLGPAKV